MQQMIFINLPVADVRASREFYAALGYHFNEQFCDDATACLVISDSIFAMLMTTERFASFTPHRVVDARTATETMLCLSAESREAVDALADKALAAGGGQVRESMDEGYLYARAFADPDGHIWETMWMDQAAVAS